jgi:hypothetical protein
MNPKIDKLIPVSVQKAFAEQGDTSEKCMADVKIICKLFNPIGAGTWWLYEHIEEDIYMAFCLLDSPQYAEIGTISLEEMVSVKLPLGLSIERDLYFEVGEKTLEQVWNEVKGKN